MEESKKKETKKEGKKIREHIKRFDEKVNSGESREQFFERVVIPEFVSLEKKINICESLQTELKGFHWGYCHWCSAKIVTRLRKHTMECRVRMVIYRDRISELENKINDVSNVLVNESQKTIKEKESSERKCLKMLDSLCDIHQLFRRANNCFIRALYLSEWVDREVLVNEEMRLSRTGIDDTEQVEWLNDTMSKNNQKIIVSNIQIATPSELKEKIKHLDDCLVSFPIEGKKTQDKYFHCFYVWKGYIVPSSWNSDTDWYMLKRYAKTKMQYEIITRTKI